ncbi:unnamed protein product, partial [Ectocarpus sp. 12 AP-2014]
HNLTHASVLLVRLYLCPLAVFLTTSLGILLPCPAQDQEQAVAQAHRSREQSLAQTKRRPFISCERGGNKSTHPRQKPESASRPIFEMLSASADAKAAATRFGPCTAGRNSLVFLALLVFAGRECLSFVPFPCPSTSASSSSAAGVRSGAFGRQSRVGGVRE